MKCPHCGNVGSFRPDVEDGELEMCNICSGEFYPSDSIEKYGEEEANKEDD